MRRGASRLRSGASGTHALVAHPVSYPAERSPSRLRRVLYSLVPLAMLLLGAEVWFRAHPHEDAYATNAGFVDPDPELIWKLKPTKGGPLATNDLGFRDTAYRDDADVKILLLGDSVSWGNGIDDVRRVYPYLLEQKLAFWDRSRSYEIVNSAVPGYSTFQQLRYFERDGLALEPDAVVLQFTLNDVVERYRALAEYGGNNYFLGVDTRNAARGAYGAMLRSSRAFEAAARWMQSRARSREEYRARNLSSDEIGAGLERAWGHTLGELERVRELCVRHDLPLLLVIAPYRFQVADFEGLRQPQDRLIDWARRNNVAHVDILAYLARASFRPELAFNDASHFSELGHSFVMELMFVPVRRLIGIRDAGSEEGAEPAALQPGRRAPNAPEERARQSSKRGDEAD